MVVGVLDISANPGCSGAMEHGLENIRETVQKHIIKLIFNYQVGFVIDIQDWLREQALIDVLH